MYPNFFKALVLLTGLFFFISCNGSIKKSPQGDQSIYYLEYGTLLKVDAYNRELSIVGFFHPAAPAVARCPDGLFWARSGENFLGALCPKTGMIEEKVPLRFRPYNHVITPDGRAYVTHHTLTSEGFLISVIDTKKKKLITEIKNIHGLRTDITYDDNFVYVAAIGVGGNDSLYLYQINIKNNRLQELYREPLNGYAWKISVHSGFLYLCHVNRGTHECSPMIDVMDIALKQIIKTVTFETLDIKQIIGEVSVIDGKLFIPCMNNRKSCSVAVFDLCSGNIEKIIPACDGIYRVIGIRDRTMIYVDNLMSAGQKGVSIYFHDLEEENVVKEINVIQFLQNMT